MILPHYTINHFNIMHRLLSKALGKRVPSPPLGPVLTQRTAYFDSQATEELLGRGHLEVRNSDTLELKLYRVDRQNRSI